MLAAISLQLPVCEVALADPTPRASAHGYRKKHKLVRHDDKGRFRKTRAFADENNAAADGKSMLGATSTTVHTAASQLIAQAIDLVGIHYRYGGKTPETGFDCSGFVSHVFREAVGVSLPHNASQMSLVGQKISHKELQPGDLVFYNTLKRAFSHVGIYVGDDKFIHSPKRGRAVEIVDMKERYWRKRFQGARRIAELEQATEIAPQTIELAYSNISNMVSSVDLNSSDDR
jgi:cell wall-associated NlpC family hydrolase